MEWPAAPTSVTPPLTGRRLNKVMLPLLPGYRHRIDMPTKYRTNTHDGAIHPLVVEVYMYTREPCKDEDFVSKLRSRGLTPLFIGKNAECDVQVSDLHRGKLDKIQRALARPFDIVVVSKSATKYTNVRRLLNFLAVPVVTNHVRSGLCTTTLQ